MAIEPVPYIDPAPVPGPQRGDESTFDDRMDAKIRWDETSAQQFGDLADNVVHNAEEALNSAVEAASQAIAANNYAVAAQSSADYSNVRADDANQSATNAAGFAVAAETSAQASANSATGLTATSATSFAVGNGSKVFVTQAGKQFPNGLALSFSSAGAPSLRMFGTVDAYSGTSLTATINSFEGSGTAADWVIAPNGAKGATGGTAGGQLTGALDEKKGTSPASSGTPDIWAAGGNYVPITQTAAITGFPNAPQPGARRTLFIVNGAPIVNDANLFVRGGSRNLQPGDRVTIEADTVSTFSATIVRGTGLPVSSLSFLRAEIYLASATIPAKISGPHRAILIGSGGSGAKASAVSGAGNVTVSATGGGAGGTCVKDYDAAAGSPYVYVAGAPGAAPSAASANGNAGSVSTFTGGSVALTANGGNGGTFSLTTATQLNGASGGTASGGDYNYQGGGSGYCGAHSITGGSGSAAQATGGGSVSWKGQVLSSGSVSVAPGTTERCALASGGAGVGGNSGAITGLAGGQSTTGGGGSAGPSAAVTASSGATGAVGPGYSLITVPILNLVGTGAGATAGMGGGSSGFASTSTSGATADAGALAGSGGAASAVTTTTGTTSVGAPGLGAGSGGVVSTWDNASTGRAGGGSLLLILY